MTYKKKLIEVALPLEIINEASAYDKMPGIGPHPKGLHHWWARLPLPCARAFLFASLINNPSSSPEFEANQMLNKKRNAKDYSISYIGYFKKRYILNQKYSKKPTQKS